MDNEQLLGSGFGKDVYISGSADGLVHGAKGCVGRCTSSKLLHLILEQKTLEQKTNMLCQDPYSTERGQGEPHNPRATSFIVRCPDEIWLLPQL